MQPNNMPTQPAMAPQSAPINPQPTPNPTPTPPPAPAKPQKASRLSLILAIVFGLIALGLAVYVVFDKLKPQEKCVNTDASTAPLSTRLSEISVPEGSEPDILKNTLAGRTFAVNPAFDEYVTFTDTSKYIFSYYSKPAEDRIAVQASSKPGNYTVNGKTINLDNGESFEITGDYLVKTTDKISKNKTAVYFDAAQLNSVIPSISLALNSYLNNNKTSESASFDKARIDRFYCRADYSIKKMTNADSYLCDTNFTYIFNQSKYKTQMETAGKQDFVTFCNMKGTPFLKYIMDGGSCNSDFTISDWSYVIVRTDNLSYRVTGVFRTIEGDTSPLPRF